MPFKIEGSCHCKAVEFSIDSNTPYPYQMCQCSICRKVGGYMGSVNIMGLTNTLEVKKGQDKIKVYHAVMDHKTGRRAGSERHFCSECSSMLWVFDEEWPRIPGYSPLHATEITKGQSDKEEETPCFRSIMRTSAPDHLPVPSGAVVFDQYGAGAGIEAWHKKHGLWVD